MKPSFWFTRCLIVKTDGYTREQVGRVVQVRANVEGLKLGEGVLDRMAAEGERGSLRYALSLTNTKMPMLMDMIVLRNQVRAAALNACIDPGHSCGPFTNRNRRHWGDE
jgi:DNA helicase TIP49 (TBP-interacting protein)